MKYYSGDVMPMKDSPNHLKAKSLKNDSIQKLIKQKISIEDEQQVREYLEQQDDIAQLIRLSKIFSRHKEAPIPFSTLANLNTLDTLLNNLFRNMVSYIEGALKLRIMNDIKKHPDKVGFDETASIKVRHTSFDTTYLIDSDTYQKVRAEFPIEQCIRHMTLGAFEWLLFGIKYKADGLLKEESPKAKYDLSNKPLGDGISEEHLQHSLLCLIKKRNMVNHNPRILHLIRRTFRISQSCNDDNETNWIPIDAKSYNFVDTTIYRILNPASTKAKNDAYVDLIGKKTVRYHLTVLLILYKEFVYAGALHTHLYNEWLIVKDEINKFVNELAPVHQAYLKPELQFIIDIFDTLKP
jgi:Abi-like protein